MNERRSINIDDLMVIDAPYSQAVDTGDIVYVAGQLAQDDPAFRDRSGTIEEETDASLRLIQRILAEAGLTMDHVVKVSVFMTDLSEFARMNTVYARFFSKGREPVRTCVGVSSLLAGAKIEIDCIARR